MVGKTESGTRSARTLMLRMPRLAARRFCSAMPLGAPLLRGSVRGAPCGCGLARGVAVLSLEVMPDTCLGHRAQRLLGSGACQCAHICSRVAHNSG